MKLLANVFLLLLISCSINNPVSSPQNTDIPVTNALVIYSKSIDDNYGIPQNRKEILIHYR